MTVQSDFEREMYLAATEEASLAELPAGITDMVRGGRVEHGPWEPAACSDFLLRWFDRGLIELYDMREGHPTNRPDVAGPPATRNGPTGLIAGEKARGMLANWEQWGNGDERWMCTRLVIADGRGEELDRAAGLTL